MAPMRKKSTLKLLTLLVLFIFLTSFFLNYSHTVVTTAWFPKQMVIELSENFKKLMKYPYRPCTCTRCIEEQRVSAWFDERFNRSMQPLLTAKNALLEEDTYKWWLVRAGAEGRGWRWHGWGLPVPWVCPGSPARRFPEFRMPVLHSFTRSASVY